MYTQNMTSIEKLSDVSTQTRANLANTVSLIGTERALVKEQENAVNTTMEAFHKIKTSVEHIAEQTIEISINLNEIDASTKDVSDQTQDMSAVAEESAASSEEISATNEEQLASVEVIASAARELSAMATELNGEISKFKIC